jgi:hypothetical protein
MRDWLESLKYYANCLFEPQPFAEKLRSWRGDEQSRILLSDEDLSGHPHFHNGTRELVASRLHAVCPDATIIVVIRRQDHFIESLYNQYIMGGGTFSILSYISYHDGAIKMDAEPCLNTMNVFQYDYVDLLRLYEKWFPGRVVVLPFELLQSDSSAYFRQWLKVLKSESTSLDFGKAINESISALEVSVARQLHRLFRSRNNPDGFIPSFIGSRHVLPASVMRSFRPLRSIRGGLGKCALPSQIAADILSHFADSNRAVDEKYGLGLRAYGYY